MIPNVYPEGWPFLKHCLDPTSPGGISDHELPQCGASSASDFGVESKVAIVGGGPGGISMAKLLHDRGFMHVTVLEKSGRIGGKSKTISLEGGIVDVGTKCA